MSRLPFVLALSLFIAVSPARAADRHVKHVVLVSVDGLSASYLTDQRAQMPNLRSMAKQGVSAQGMVTTFPSVTWPSHTSLITGTFPARHGVIGNSVWNRETQQEVKYIGDPVLTKDEAIRVPTLYDVAHKAGLSTASVIWPCSNGAQTLNWMIPDSNKTEIHARYTTPGFADELAAAGVDISKLGEWGWGKQHSTNRDIVYTQVTKHLLTQHNVELILLHLITPDGVEHGYGPNTPAAYQAVAESDQRLGEIRDALQQPPFAGNSTMFVVSDHGFAPYEKLIRPNVVLKDLGLIKTDAKNKVTERSAWCVAQGGSAFIYVLDDERRTEITAMLADRLGGVEGVLNVMSPSEFTQLGVPDPGSNPEAPHLVLTTGPGYSFDNSVKGSAVADAGGHKGSHGHDPRPDYMHATFVAVGRGIKPDTKLEFIRNVDVAPTIAYLLGLQMDTDGRVLREALTIRDAR
jgi:predicted AlkP superfamily pyrophosphatase or phosphodiesterase